MIRTQRVRVRVRVVACIYSNQTIHCQQILCGVGFKVVHCRVDAPRSNPTRAILNFFSLKIEETYTFMNRNFQRQRNFM